MDILCSVLCRQFSEPSSLSIVHDVHAIENVIESWDSSSQHSATFRLPSAGVVGRIMSDDSFSFTYLSYLVLLDLTGQ